MPQSLSSLSPSALRPSIAWRTCPTTGTTWLGLCLTKSSAFGPTQCVPCFLQSEVHTHGYRRKSWRTSCEHMAETHSMIPREGRRVDIVHVVAKALGYSCTKRVAAAKTAPVNFNDGWPCSTPGNGTSSLTPVVRRMLHHPGRLPRDPRRQHERPSSGRHQLLQNGESLAMRLAC